MHRAVRNLSVIAALVFMLAACGADDNDKEGAPVQVTEISAVNNGDVSSGCWVASMRSSSESSSLDDVSGNDGSVTADQEGSIQSMQWKEAPALVIDTAKTYTAEMVTSEGSFTITLLPGEAPLAANNFLCLAKAGYYDGTPFHRIVAGFVLQGGDPTGTGSGGPGYKFNDEPVNLNYTKGSVAMANAGVNTNGSQFFVVLDDLTGKLPKNYTIFGQVTEGQEVVDAIGKLPTQVGRSGEKSTPIEPVTLESVTITES